MARTDRSLQRFPRPWVAVDTAVLTLTYADDGTPGLSVLQVKKEGGGGWCLPGVLLAEGERLTDAAARGLRDKAGLSGVRSRQLHVLDDPGRDDRGRVLSIGHVAVVSADRVPDTADVRLAAATAPGRMPWGQADIVARALDDLRARYATAPDPDRFMPATFTLRELREVHEAIAGEALQRDTFRRAMEGNLRATGEVVLGGRGRPAELFRRT